MIDLDPASPCPCGRGEAYARCCGPIHDGDPAPSAERLMRSRYSAFALGRAEYLLESWDPSTRPTSLELDEDLVWRRLLVESVSAGGPLDREGWVTFTAIARGPSGRVVQRERSRFVRVPTAAGGDDRWRYADGEELEPEV